MTLVYFQIWGVTLIISLFALAWGGVPPLQVEDYRLIGDEFPGSLTRTNNFQKENALGNNLLPTNISAVVPSNSYRLPRDIVPLQYRLFLRPVLNEVPEFTKFSVPGNVTIKVRCVTDGTTKIVLHHRNINIQESGVTVIRVSGGVENLAGDKHYDSVTELYTIEVEETLNVGEELEIFIPFTSHINQDDYHGIYLSYYDDPETEERRYLATTQCQPTHARAIFPCFDEPEWKATFDVSIARHTGYHTLSNTHWESDQEDVYADWIWDHFHPTPVLMSTYLFAVIVSDFKYKEAVDNPFNKPIRTYGPPHLIEEAGGDFSAGAVLEILKYYQAFVGIEYAYEKLDSVAIPQFSAGAMENWGLNTYRVEYLIHIPGENTEAERKKITQVLSHEVTHQWYGNLVTCKWWSYTWLNEGFARFLQYRGMNAGAPEFETLIAVISDATQLGMIFDQGASSHPVIQDVSTPEEISDHFSRITYDKAASLLRMLEGIYTVQGFDNSIKHYLHKMKEKVAESKDLLDSFQTIGSPVLPPGVTIHDVMEPWLQQSGFPLVRVNIADRNAIYLSQERFMLNTGSSPSASANLWYVPVRVVHQDLPDFEDKRPDTWIKNGVAVKTYTNSSLDTTSKWLVVNPDLSGYYRVLYDVPLRRLIKDQLDESHTAISRGTRSQILDDYFHFAFNGYAPIEAALELTDYIGKELELVVWAQLLTHLRTIFNQLSGDDIAFSHFKGFYAPKFAQALEGIGLVQGPEDVGMKVILRASLLDFSCAFYDTACISYAQEQFALWDTVNTRILPDIRPVVFCTAVANGGQGSWNKAYTFFQNEPRAATKTQFYKALACAKDAGILNVFLTLATENVEGLNLVTVCEYLAGNSVGRTVAYEHIKENFGKEASPLQPGDVAKIINAFSNYWNKEDQLDDLAQFVQSHDDIWDSATRSSLDASVRKIRRNQEWFRKFGIPITAYFQQKQNNAR